MNQQEVNFKRKLNVLNVENGNYTDRGSENITIHLQLLIVVYDLQHNRQPTYNYSNSNEDFIILLAVLHLQCPSHVK